jgi:hypothetical protein
VIAVARPNLSDAKSRAFEELLNEYDDMFSINKNDYRRTHGMYYRIGSGEARPIRQPPGGLPPAKQVYVGEMHEDMQKRGEMEESDSPWSSPVLFVWKKNGDLCFCVDCRKLNDVTRKHSFPLARIHDNLDTLHRAK